MFTHQGKMGYIDRTTFNGGHPLRQTADIFVPVAWHRSIMGGMIAPNTTPQGNKGSRPLTVVESRPPLIFGEPTTKLTEVSMAALAISNTPIRQVDGLYSLNDLHQASGAENRHQPRYFLANQQTKELIAEIQNSENPLFNPAIRVSQGKTGGTYACKELVVAYAAWISPSFHLKVIRAFLDRNPAKGQRFIMEVKDDGSVSCQSIQDFYRELPQFIQSTVCPFDDGLVVLISKACIENLEYRAGSRQVKINRLMRNAKEIQQ